MYKGKSEVFSCNHCCYAEAISITCIKWLWLCVCVAEVTQHALHMPSVTRLALPYFSPLSHKGTIFFGEKKLFENRMCFDFLYNYCVLHFLFQEELSEMLLQMCIMLHVKYPLFLSDFKWNFNFSRQIFGGEKILIYHTSWKSVQWETDGRTDMT